MVTNLYETDFYQWTLRQADLLRSEDYTELDVNHLIEEIEDMGNNNRRELGHRLMRILEHLLKLRCEPQSRAARHWRRSILTQRIELDDLLKTNYTLRVQAGDFVDDAYQKARRLAAAGTACAVEDFPAQCEWTIEQLLDLDWLP